MVGGAFYAPPRPRLSLQTPASDRVNPKDISHYMPTNFVYLKIDDVGAGADATLGNKSLYLLIHEIN